MSVGIHGPLLATSFLEAELPVVFAGRLGERTRERAHRRLRAWWSADGRWLGPASSLRTLVDRGVLRLVSLLGYGGAFRAAPTGAVPFVLGELQGAAGEPVAVLVIPWGENLGRVWRDAVRHGIRLDAAWCVAFNGCALRFVDVRRTYARRFLEFDLETAARDARAFEVLWGLGRAEALALLDEAASASERHRVAVCGSLQLGVDQALAALLRGVAEAAVRSRRARGRMAGGPVFEQALTMIYRLLFLLFAEARGAVPLWHPLYRASYSLEALRDRLDAGGPARGLWQALQAISRLAHEGCHAGDLEATGFNGRLFSPARAPLLERLSVGDNVARETLAALTTRADPRAGRRRISYVDLGVEQLGAVYERVLDYEPHLGTDGVRLEVRRAGGRRKATGTFYTPRSLTEYLVRRTLAPLVDEAAPEAILDLRVVDPAMGSGAFLVAACRYLARAYETALAREGRLRPGEVDHRDRAAWRRTIAQQCLFGVDRNPMAVQLARLSLWLTTLATDRPLTFLDHNLRVGDSLLGASLDDVARQPPGGRHRSTGRTLPLLDGDDLGPALRAAVAPRARIAREPGDSLDAVREKERALARLESPEARLSRWKAVCDLWCAAWFWRGRREMSPALFGALTDTLLGRAGQMPAHLSRDWLARARAAAAAHRFFHWTLEFPEIFFDPDGQPLAAPGFDAVLGNPPWEMVRADEGDRSQRDDRRRRAAEMLRFARASGVYRASGQAHLNLYQLFVERALALARHRGRIGLVLPAGLATDHGAAALRRLLLDRCDTDAIVGLENRQAIFPIHRSVRFLLVTATRGEKTSAVVCRFGLERPDALDAIGDRGDRDALPIALTPAFLRRISGDALIVPWLRSAADQSLLDKISSAVPPLGHPDGWGARFGRELNATDDRHCLTPPGEGLPVVGGREIEPFVVRLDACARAIPEAAAALRLDRSSTFGRPRLAYRDVTSATNRLTLLAAVVPAGVVTLHTLFCLRTPLAIDEQHVLCGLLNSYVVNYLVRQRITSHITTATMQQLPVPRPGPSSPVFRGLAALARELAARGGDRIGPVARLNALVAQLYGLTLAELDHVLSTFPLIAEEEKAATRAAFSEII